MSAAIASFDWGKTSLGPIEQWPQSLRTIVDTMSASRFGMCAVWGPDQILIYNDAYAPILGSRHPAALGLPFREAWPDVWDDIEPLIAEAMAGRAVLFEDMHLIMTRNGYDEDTWWSFSYSPLRDESGAIVGFLDVVLDSTAKVLNERRFETDGARLRETEERLRLAVSATNDAIWDWDLAGDYVLWNDALESAYGHQRAGVEPSGAWWMEHIHADDRARIDRSIHAVIDGTETDWTEEYRFRRGDGSYADVKDRGYVIRNGSGRAIRMLGAMLDQTDRKEAERTLERAKAKLEQTVEERTFERDQIWQSSPDLLCVVTSDGRLKEINPAWVATLGWSEEELTSRPFVHYVHPDDVDRTIRATNEIKDGDSLFGFENRYRTKSGNHVWLNWNAVSRGGLVYAVVRDVTAAHDQREALAKAEEQLRQSQKMEAVGQLTGGIAHDFNNMLTGVMGSLELLKRYIAEGRTDKIERYIDAATTSAQRAAGLTQRLLAFSRRQSLDVQAVDVNHVVIGMEDLLRRTLGERVGLDIRLHAGGWNAVSDANQLESALLNLAINARDAMPDGGLLTIEGANIVLEAESASGFEDFEPGDYVVVSVTDTGTGMSEEVAAKAFDPFFTTKPIGQGTGLGLSMIYGFLRQTGGQVRIFSQLGQGTTVKLYLPRHQGAVEPIGTGVKRQVAAGQGETVMVVEDDAAVRMLVVDVLEGLGYDVIHAADGRQAILLLEDSPPITLLVTDVGLPGINGRQVAELARKQRPDLKVLFVTGYAEQAADRSSFLDEGMEMITKPFAVDALAEKVQGMIKAGGTAA
jgi:PAS domain S-box-containing protein